MRRDVTDSDGGTNLHSNRWPGEYPDGVKVVFVLEPGMPYETEALWAKPIGDGLFELDNVPFFVFGVSCGDKVYAHTSTNNRLEFSGVATPSGHSTYRVILAEGVPESRVEHYWRALSAMGCYREGANARYWSIDVPPTTDIFRVYALLENAAAEKVWTFEEGHVGHAVR